MNQKNTKIKQAWFLIFNIKIKEHPVASLFIQVLFLLPIPLFIPKFIIQIIPNKVFYDLPFTKKDVKQLIGAKGVLVDIKTREGDKVLIKSI